MAVFLTNGKSAEIWPCAMARSTAWSGNSKEWAARLWQSTHCISNVGRELTASALVPLARYVRVDAGRAVGVLDPGNGLPLLVGGGVADAHAGSHVRSMNAAQASASHPHHQDRLHARVGFIVLELAVDAEARADEPLAGVALLTSIGGGDQPVAFQARIRCGRG